MDRKGYPRETRLLGHAQGVDLVERPALSPLGDNLPIQENMIVSLHPTTHGANAWGYPVNMSFLVTKTGSQRMLSTPQEIIVL
jgi:Xaa-Pro aminopeptidase